ncbi:MAG: undecaprenyl-diphosphate phosphatase [Candidatus Magnetobacterium sp. LHC-1]|uniref:Undecaprenyl-diphosphatase n=1 Tax=Candidatus Magnetobacterium casense TaxID=1455061 RepID=A0ABS6RYB2_9BACT|nr:undecaprenyl-diphosphate phosphatase [Candidatus Magnetobacterium casensis]MBF0609011.1 undecaprenyl-diphosphate phosphatase [Nitrospirota bacterium]MBV6341320.1 undecaprenyl-diphosphate phosphatase [Candidatus Magnetobacterium casensis]
MSAEILQSIILGAVQGVTEFFPISSTAHLVLIPWVFGWHGITDSMSFDIALHVGTLLALLLYFFKDWLDILLKKHKLLGLLIVATIPAAVAGKLLDEFVEETLRSPLVIAASLVVVGFVMLYVERIGTREKSIRDMDIYDSVMVGIAQAIAIIPGVSRSGITISAGLALNITREEAARFSFLMSTPVVGGAALLHGVKLLHGTGAGLDLNVFLCGIAASFITGLIAIKFLMAFFKKYSLRAFVYYRFTLAGVIVLLLWLKN